MSSRPGRSSESSRGRPEPVTLRSHLAVLLAAVIYPLWLTAGTCDYFLHRKGRIERTSGRRESLFHVAQFASLAVPVVLIALFAFTPPVLIAAVTCVGLHAWLAHADTVYTAKLRRISALEQLVHGFMNVLPVAAVGILAAMHWNGITSLGWTLRSRDPPLPWRDAALFIGSYFVLAGLPILEEYLRTSGRLGHHQVEHNYQGRERHHA